MDAKNRRSARPDDEPLFIRSTYVPRQQREAPTRPAAPETPVSALASSHLKQRKTAAGLAIVLGGFGAHHFYLGDARAGAIYLTLCWTLIPSVLGVIQGVNLLAMTDDAFNAKYNRIGVETPFQHLAVIAEELRNLGELRKAGTISEEEFAAKRDDCVRRLSELT